MARNDDILFYGLSLLLTCIVGFGIWRPVETEHDLEMVVFLCGKGFWPSVVYGIGLFLCGDALVRRFPLLEKPLCVASLLAGVDIFIVLATLEGLSRPENQ